MSQPFVFKQFTIHQDQCAMKIGTDGVLLGAWVDISGKSNALDIGTGTGVIALMLAQRNPAIQVSAVEIDHDAAQQALLNFANSEFSSRLDLIESSIQHFAIDTRDTFDLIVSNPPFFTGGTLSISQDKASVRHTVKLPHSDLLGAARNLLTKDGRLAVILPEMEGVRLMELAQTYNLHVHRICNVFPDENKKVERLMIELGKSSSEHIEENNIYIRQAGQDAFTEEYKKMTQDFYLKF
jgi:tRNA1Val (adenine37-N6)-methyltransferase